MFAGMAVIGALADAFMLVARYQPPQAIAP
jgi:hypothetical protein